ncbi:MAG: hypothetical protein CMO01_15295 [Thalassobius sp.]|nr:hypothetical protein [Thalassovita sp.]
MLELLFKTSFRNLLKNKLLTIINVLGLSVGITCVLVVYLIISHENSYDKFQSNYENIFHIYTEYKSGKSTGYNAGIPPALPLKLKEEVPEIEILSSIYYGGGILKALDDNKDVIKSEGLHFYTVGIDSNYFNLFDWEWISGSPIKSFINKESVVITEKTAQKLFGSLDVLGKEVNVNDEYFVTVTGILKNSPYPSNFGFDAFFPIALIQPDHINETNWTGVSSGYQSYFLLNRSDEKLQEEANLIEEKINKLYAKNGSDSWKIKIRPLSSIHFDPNMHSYIGTLPNPQILWYLFWIALVIIISACINYINLSTAFSILRSSEIGIRKVLGSSRKLLIMQFMGETLVMICIATILSFCFTELFLIHIDVFSFWKFDSSLFSNALIYNRIIYLFIPSLILIITILSGFYPAFMASGYHPIKALKDKLDIKNSSGYSLRRSLVFLQFCLCQVFILGTLVIMYQLDFMQNSDMGFDKDHILTIDLPDSKKKEVLTNEWNNIEGIKSISLSNSSPISSGWTAIDTSVETDSSITTSRIIDLKVDSVYFDLYRMNFVAGANYKERDSTEAVIVNQQFLSRFGFKNPAEAIGKKVITNKGEKFRIISGVVEDFHLQSFHSQIPAIMMSQDQESYYVLNAKISPVNRAETLAAMHSVWKSLFPETEFKYDFLEDRIYRMYKSEEQVLRLFNLFSGIAIFINCLGLFGLVSFMSLRKTKEIGIRKVFGASISQIVMLFSKEFLLLVISALVVAGPIGYYFMNIWLEDYAYKIDIGWTYFALTLCIALLITLLSVSYQSIKSALRNPAEALRSE